jgi:hypothetical protein
LFNKFDEVKGYLGLTTIFLIDLFVLIGVITLFLGTSDEILAGIIGFIGAIIGGVITYLGVNKTLNHRDQELFMTNATEKLMIIDNQINIYNKFLNSAFLLENYTVDRSIKEQELIRITKLLYEELDKNNNNIYKCLEYNAIKIIDFHKKTLNALLQKRTLTDEEMEKCIDKIRSIYQIFNNGKVSLEEKYYQYKRKHN